MQTLVHTLDTWQAILMLNYIKKLALVFQLDDFYIDETENPCYYYVSAEFIFSNVKVVQLQN